MALWPAAVGLVLGPHKANAAIQITGDVTPNTVANDPWDLRQSDSPARMSVGEDFDGSILIDDGSDVFLNYLSVGSAKDLFNSGTVTVAGQGSTLTGIEILVGWIGEGTLIVEQGAVVTTENDIWLGWVTHFSESRGTIYLNQGTLNTGGFMFSPDDLEGAGTVNTQSMVSNIDLVFDATHGLQQTLVFDEKLGQNITVNLDVSGSDLRGALGAGFFGTGTLTIADGRVIHSRRGWVGTHAGAVGTATVHGAGSQWNTTDLFSIGNFDGHGTLLISDGGEVNSDYLSTVGNGGVGVVRITGAGSKWNSNASLRIGSSEEGNLFIESGGSLNSFEVYLGYYDLSFGIATVSGAGSRWDSDSIYIGERGEATLRVQSGGAVRSVNVYLAHNHASAEAMVYVQDQGSRMTIEDTLYVGESGTARLSVLNGGEVVSHKMLVSASGTVDVDVGGRMVIDNTLTIELGIVRVDGGHLDVDTLDMTRGRFKITDGSLMVGEYLGIFRQHGGTLLTQDATGTARISKNYDLLAGAIAIGIGGTEPGSGHDKVSVGWSLNLGADSVLDVQLTDAFVPGINDRFNILEFTSLTGHFHTIKLPALGGNLWWDTSMLYEKGTLLLTDAHPGDLDDDGDVDGVDLGMLYANFNGPGGGVPINRDTDFDLDSDVDGVDVGIFFSQFTGPLAPATVPEPASFVLLALGGLWMTRRRV